MDDKEISAIIEHINDTIIINNCGCHGMGHAKRVMNYVEILLRGIDASDHEIELGLIAAYLHDIGAIMGKQGHAERSADYVLMYLKKMHTPDEDIHIIEHAIRNHSGGANLESVIGAALTFADKIDMQKKRMLRFIDDNYFHENIKHILDIHLSVNQENIVVDIITDGMFDYNSLTSYTKMITKPVEMSNYLNRECVFQIDGKKIDVNDAFVKHVRQNVLQICGNLGIDSNNFCFDIDARNKLFNYEDGYGVIGNAGMSNQSFTNGQK